MDAHPVASAALDVLYFAYGSNLCLRRMLGRASSARRVAAATLPGYSLTWSKIGVDGSGKCTIQFAAEAWNSLAGGRDWGGAWLLIGLTLCGLGC